MRNEGLPLEVLRTVRLAFERIASAYAGLEVAGSRRWNEVRPLLLRSAGVVGLAAAIVAVISSETLFGDEDPRAYREALRTVAQDPIEAKRVAAVTVRDTGAFSPPAPGVFAPRAKAPSGIKAVAAPAYAAGAVALPPGPPAAPADPAAARSVPPAPAPNAASAAAAEGAPAPAPAPTQIAAREEAIGEPVPVQPAPAVDCPRGWIAFEGDGDIPAQCGEAAPLLDFVSLSQDQKAIEDAALERAAEIAGLQFAPRIPKLRPEPPRDIKKASTRKALAKWPADPPPNCGTKRAKWRYVDRVPTWYCR